MTMFPMFHQFSAKINHKSETEMQAAYVAWEKLHPLVRLHFAFDCAERAVLSCVEAGGLVPKYTQDDVVRNRHYLIETGRISRTTACSNYLSNATKSAQFCMLKVPGTTDGPKGKDDIQEPCHWEDVDSSFFTDRLWLACRFAGKALVNHRGSGRTKEGRSLSMMERHWHRKRLEWLQAMHALAGERMFSLILDGQFMPPEHVGLLGQPFSDQLSLF